MVKKTPLKVFFSKSTALHILKFIKMCRELKVTFQYFLAVFLGILVSKFIIVLDLF